MEYYSATKRSGCLELDREVVVQCSKDAALYIQSQLRTRNQGVWLHSPCSQRCLISKDRQTNQRQGRECHVKAKS